MRSCLASDFVVLVLSPPRRTVLSATVLVLDGKMHVALDGAVRQWEALQWTKKAHVLFNRTSLDSIVGHVPTSPRGA
jgi:hypothetical protein